MERVRTRAGTLAFAVVLLLGGAATSWAQTETGRLTGIVVDQSGGVLPGATVSLTSTTTGASRTTVTDSQGRYTFANLLPGTYTEVVKLSGFKDQSVNVVIGVGASVSADLKLAVAGASETVTVSAETPRINVTNGELSTTIREEQLRDLPTLTRNPYDFVGIAGNVVADPTGIHGSGFAINGMRSASTNVLLDGSANNDEFSATIGQNVPIDAVQEFSVITSSFSAQYGRASGGIVNLVTKSGTNLFRGTAYDFYRSDSLSANTVDNIANGIPKGQFTRNQVGYSIGGPVVKDKVHFFSSLEYIPIRSHDTEISWIPTPELLAASNAATRQFFDTYGKGATINGPVLSRSQVSAIFDPTGAGAGAFNQLPANLPAFGQVQKSLPIDAGGGNPGNEYQFVGRVDLNFGTSASAYIRYAYQNQATDPGTNASSPYAGYDTGLTVNNHNILGSYTKVYNSNLTGQTKVVFNQVANDQPLNGDPQPTLYMNPTVPVTMQGYRIAFPGYLPWAPGNAIPFGGPQRLLQIYQDQTWLRGSHDFRFGGSFVNMTDDRTFGAYANAVEDLSRTNTPLTSLDNLVTGNLQRFQTAINPEGYPGGTYTTPVGLPSFLSNNKYNEFALYANDDWSLTPRFKVNLGVRYEYYGPQTKSTPKYDSNFYYPSNDTSVNTASPADIVTAVMNGKVFPSNESPIGKLYQPDWNNWAPRLGFAWDVKGDGQMSVRGGYGIAYERNFGNVTYNVLFNPPQYLVASIDAGAGRDVPSMPIFVDPSGPFGGVAGVTKPIPAGSLRHVDENIENAYSHIYSAAFSKIFARTITVSVEYSGSSGRKLYDLADVNKPGAAMMILGIGNNPFARPNPNYNAFNTRANRGQSQYHGVTFSIDARRFGHTGLMLNASYTLAQAKDNLSSTFSESSNNFNLGYLDAFDPMLDYGYAEFDVRHRVSGAAIWNLPWGHDATGAKRLLIAGWQVNAIFVARSGYPFTVWDCSNQDSFYCIRAIDPVGINKNATGSTPTGNPNEYTLLDLTPIAGAYGSYVNPLTGTVDYGPYPDNMTKRDAFRAPGLWNVDFAMSKRFLMGQSKAIQFRWEIYNVFNHANMFVHGADAEVGVGQITGFKDGNRRMQLGFKFEF